MNPNSHTVSRRRFLGQSLSCGTYVAALAALSPLTARKAYGQSTGDVVTEEPWGRIEKIADNMWAVISDFTKGDRTTICNGGIIAGDQGVLAVEAFMTPKGATWLAEWAEKLTERWPTDVIISHYHGDHSAGDAGYQRNGESLRLWVTEKTHELIAQSRKQANNEADLENVESISKDEATKIDLGNRQVQVHPGHGHTESDVTVRVSDPSIIWTGDLFFNRMVPNYRDSFPAKLTEEVTAMVDSGTTYVPGHGPIADHEALKSFIDFLGVIEEAAEKAHASGKSAEEAAGEFQLPKPFEDYYIFAPSVMPNAFAAWYRQFDGEKNRP